jgi:hypothetical protein
VRLFTQYKDDEKDRLIEATWVREQVSALRKELGVLCKNRSIAGEVSQPTITRWRAIAGVSKGSKPDGSLIPDNRRKISPKEAAGVVLLALWEPYVKGLIGSEVDSGNLTPLNLKPMFNRWAAKASDPGFASSMTHTMIRTGLTQADFQKKVEELLQTIYTARGYTYGEIHKDANRAAGKKIPRSTIRGWATEAGGRYLKDELCPWKIAGSILMKASEEATRSQQSSASCQA